MNDVLPLVVDNVIRLIEHVGPCVVLVLANWAFILLLHGANVTRLGRIEANQAAKG